MYILQASNANVLLQRSIRHKLLLEQNELTIFVLHFDSFGHILRIMTNFEQIFYCIMLPKFFSIFSQFVKSV